MHLSNELQSELEKIESSVKVNATIYGTFPENSAFYHDGNRKFITEYAVTQNQFSIVLYEWCNELKYNHCFARGLFTDIERLARVIDLWVDRQVEATVIKTQFDELEIFQDFELRNTDPRIDFAWKKVKNMIFNDLTYWKTPEWNTRYLELLNHAKKHKEFITLFPFTSHYWLRFSVDKDKKETWTLNTYIFPTMYSEEIPETIGRYYVSYNDEPMGGKFFDNVNMALDFYAEKLKETKPIRWVV